MYLSLAEELPDFALVEIRPAVYDTFFYFSDFYRDNYSV